MEVDESTAVATAVATALPPTRAEVEETTSATQTTEEEAATVAAQPQSYIHIVD